MSLSLVLPAQVSSSAQRMRRGTLISSRHDLLPCHGENRQCPIKRAFAVFAPFNPYTHERVDPKPNILPLFVCLYIYVYNLRVRARQRKPAKRLSRGLNSY